VYTLSTRIVFMQVFWYVTPCRPVNCYRHFEGAQYFFFRVNRSMKSLLVSLNLKTLLRNIDNYLSFNTAYHAIRLECSKRTLWELPILQYACSFVINDHVYMHQYRHQYTSSITYCAVYSKSQTKHILIKLSSICYNGRWKSQAGLLL
jgi:hypothetical protein